MSFFGTIHQGLRVLLAGGSNTVITEVVDALATPVSSNRKGKQKARAEDSTPLAEQTGRDAVVANVYLADCTNIMYTMKAIVGGFVDKTQQKGHIQCECSGYLAEHR